MGLEIYCDCGALLVEDVTSAGVRPPGGDVVIPFRRTTDYVVCSNCMLAYDVRSLIARAQSAELIEGLQQLADRQTSSPTDDEDIG
jgi:hypothetical protein